MHQDTTGKSQNCETNKTCAARAVAFRQMKPQLSKRTSQTSAGGGFIRVGVRVRPLGEGRGERGKVVKIDARNGTIDAAY